MTGIDTPAQIIDAIESERIAIGMGVAEAARAAGWKRADQWSCFTRENAKNPSLESLMRMLRAVGLRISLDASPPLR